MEEGGILKVDESKGHDALAKRIGENAQRFVKQTWRWEDMQVYVSFYNFVGVRGVADEFP